MLKGTIISKLKIAKVRLPSRYKVSVKKSHMLFDHHLFNQKILYQHNIQLHLIGSKNIHPSLQYYSNNTHTVYQPISMEYNYKLNQD
jgi:hypothetical protein